MTQTAYTNAIMNALLGWLKGFANWVLKLFDLAGGSSPLRFLADNWLKLLIIFLVLGVAVDLTVWLIRWRPHWVWFRKKRIIINDASFFADENEHDENGEPLRAPGRVRLAKPKKNWEDREYIVPSAQRVKREGEAQRRKREAEQQRRAAEAQRSGDVFTDGMFNVDAKQRFSDRYEDEVFSVSDLPLSTQQRDAHNQARRPVHQRGRTAASRSMGSKQLTDKRDAARSSSGKAAAQDRTNVQRSH